MGLVMIMCWFIKKKFFSSVSSLWFRNDIDTAKWILFTVLWQKNKCRFSKQLEFN